jgi:hypothetical protein
MFGGAFGTGGRIDLWSDQMKQRAQKHVSVYKKIRKYLLKDYYPLTPQPGDIQSWSGWQFQDPITESGFIQTFRTKTVEDSHRFPLRKLDQNGLYRFTDAYTNDSFDIVGSSAMKEGVFVKQDRMSSRLFSYEKVKRSALDARAGQAVLK